MLVKELLLDDLMLLKDRSTGEDIATVRIASFVQYPSHTAVRLGFDAPQNIKILKLDNGKKELPGKNGHTQRHTQ